MAEPYPEGRLTDAEILRSVEHTVHDVLLPALPDGEEWARAIAVQLIGLVRYALHRDGGGPDGDGAAAGRAAEVGDALAGLAGNELIAAVWEGDRSEAAVMGAAGAALASAVGRDDAAADAVRSVLRPVLLAHLDDELAATAPLVDAFRGRLDD